MKDNLTDAESDMLIRLLATIEAYFEPCRESAWIGQYRDRFCCPGAGANPYPGAGTLPFDAGGTDAASKKAAYRTLMELQTQGLAVTANRAAGLTSEGLRVAREICGGLQIEDCLPGLDFMAGLIGTKHDWRIYDHEPMGVLSEASIAGGQALQRGKIHTCRLKDSEMWVCDALIPLAVAGLVDHTFLAGAWYESPLYFLTDAGRALAKKRKGDGTAAPLAWLKLAKRETTTPNRAVYTSAWLAVRNAAPNIQPLDAHRIGHYLSSSMHPGD